MHISVLCRDRCCWTVFRAQQTAALRNRPCIVDGSERKPTAQVTLFSTRHMCDHVCHGSENCVWEEDSCTVERNYTFRQFLLGVDLNTVDPICASYQVQLDSGCLELKTNATCSKNENCGWREQTQGTSPFIPLAPFLSPLLVLYRMFDH